jgi:hypothetical protein
VGKGPPPYPRHENRGPGTGGHQPIEEPPVARERDAEVFGRHLVAAIPLSFEPLPFVGEARRKTLHQVGDESVGPFDRLARLVDEARLDLLPAAREALSLVDRQQRAGLRHGIPSVSGLVARERLVRRAVQLVAL